MPTSSTLRTSSWKRIVVSEIAFPRGRTATRYSFVRSTKRAMATRPERSITARSRW